MGLGFLSSIISGSSLLPSLAALAGAGLLVILGIRGISGALNVVMLCGGFLVSMNALRAGPEVSAADAMFGIAALLALVLTTRRSNKDYLKSFLPAIFLIALVIFGGLSGSFSSTDQVGGLAELGRFAASSMLLLFIVALWAPTPKRIQGLAWAIVLGTTLNAALSFGVEKLAGRAMGLSNHPNHLGLACALSIGAALGLAFTTRRSGLRGVLFVCVCLLSAAILASGSRAALLGSVVSVMVFVVASKPWKLVAWGLLATAVVLSVAQAGFLYLGEFNAFNRIVGDSSALASDRARTRLAADAIEMIWVNPIIGSGFEQAKVAHSIYLQLWVSAGVLGIVAIGGLGYLVVRVLLKARREDNFLAIGLASSFLGYLAAGAFSNILWDRYVWLHLAMLLASKTSFRPPSPAQSDPITIQSTGHKTETSFNRTPIEPS